MGAILIRLLRWLLGTALIAAVLINLANVLGRYVFSRPIQATDEILVYLLVWCVFLGSVVVSWEDRHLRMDVVSSLLAAPARRLLSALAFALFAGIAVFQIAQSGRFLARLHEIGQTSIATGIPMIVPHAAIPLGFALMLLVVFLRWRRHVLGDAGKSGSPPSGHGKVARDGR